MKSIIFITAFFFTICGNFAFSAELTQRIISLAPATTEILFALGLDDNIVGVTSFCNYPAAADSKEEVGTFSYPNLEKIVSLKPDIIFATGMEQDLAVIKLRQLGFDVFVSDPACLEELLVSIKEIGEVTGKKSEAFILISRMVKQLRQIKSKTAAISEKDRPKVFLELGSRPLMTAGKGSFVDEVISLAGGRNIAYDTPRTYSYFSPEQVIDRNPDCIILGFMDKTLDLDSFQTRLGWSKVKAVRDGRIYGDINPDLIFRPGPRLADGVEAVYKRIHN